MVDARKLRFERSWIKQAADGCRGHLRDDPPPRRHSNARDLAVPITNDGQVVLLRQYRFAVQARLLEFPAGTLEDGEDPLESITNDGQVVLLRQYRSGSWGKKPATALRSGMCWGRCSPALVIPMK